MDSASGRKLAVSESDNTDSPANLPARRAGGSLKSACHDATSLASRATLCNSAASSAAPAICAFAANCVGSKRPPRGIDICSSRISRTSAASRCWRVIHSSSVEGRNARIASRPTGDAAKPATSESSGCHSSAARSACTTGDGMGSSSGILRNYGSVPGSTVVQAARFEERSRDASSTRPTMCSWSTLAPRRERQVWKKSSKGRCCPRRGPSSRILGPILSVSLNPTSRPPCFQPSNRSRRWMSSPLPRSRSRTNLRP